MPGEVTDCLVNRPDPFACLHQQIRSRHAVGVPLELPAELPEKTRIGLRIAAGKVDLRQGLFREVCFGRGGVPGKEREGEPNAMKRDRHKIIFQWPEKF